MYDKPRADEETLVRNAVALLSSKTDFDQACELVLSRWSVSAKVHLTNTEANRQSWLGQSACCLVHGTPEIFTRVAWSRLTEEQQDTANKVADYWIDFYERQTRETCIALDAAWLPGWDTGRSARSLDGVEQSA
jgi:hypothetical protein